MEYIFFTLCNNDINGLNEHIKYLKEIQKELYIIFENDDNFFTFLQLTNFEGIVECFTNKNISVNYDHIILYIKNNIKSDIDMNVFLKEIVIQSMRILNSKKDIFKSSEFISAFPFLCDEVWNG